jgi:hypothetical protein
MVDAMKDPKFLTQKQLAQRWLMSESCVKNYRTMGLLPFFQLPRTARVLYPVAEIERIEQENITSCQGKEINPRPEKQRKTPEVSSTTSNAPKWRI